MYIQFEVHVKLWKHIEVHMKVLGWCLPQQEQQQYIRFGREPAWRHIVWQPGNPWLFYSHLYPSKKMFSSAQINYFWHLTIHNCSCIVGRVEKSKNGIYSYGYCFLVAFWYVETRKNIFFGQRKFFVGWNLTWNLTRFFIFPNCHFFFDRPKPCLNVS